MNELRRKIKQGDKAGIEMDFEVLVGRISKEIDEVERLSTMIFIWQLRDYIIEQL